MSRRNMDAIQIEEFLKNQVTGVLSLARENDGYGVPLSYWFDEDDSSFYFRMGYAPGSQKRKFIDASQYVTFVVYADTEEGWKSVLAEGELEVLSEDTIDASIEEVTRHLDIPYYEVHERPIDELEFDILRMRVTKLNGIAEGHMGA
ncbi:pyridoxamine 5'-phosphate oxidase family protein [Halomicroarcula sp. GCM10025324]|uniref:pyridoxamine 5'-phosphate oxidase family protein n=1 Tax=Haloarcula TaxID=2237 RepID=UPI0023E7A01A|nr:pyridoxamine 5'-phosphate oxidase family protein [Halomicroarcula sp. ZS-22-S1]